MSSRPAGVTFVAVLAWIGALAQFASGYLVLSGVLHPRGVTDQSAWILILVGAFASVVAALLLGGSNTARVLMTVSFAISLLSAGFSLIAHPGNVVSPMLTGFSAILGLVLLYTRAANDFFRR